MTLSSLLTEKAREIPKKTCIKFEKRKLTYADLDEAVNVTAGGLSKLGLNVKDRAAILMENLHIVEPLGIFWVHLYKD